MTDREAFRAACLNGTATPAHLSHHRPGRTCRGCGGDVDADTFDVWVSYWQSMWFPCHKACRAAGVKEEARMCQTVDADCNDCAHFARGGPATKWACPGRCQKYDRPTTAYPNFSSGHSCFEHRKGAA